MKEWVTRGEEGGGRGSGDEEREGREGGLEKERRRECVETIRNLELQFKLLKNYQLHCTCTVHVCIANIINILSQKRQLMGGNTSEEGMTSFEVGM